MTRSISWVRVGDLHMDEADGLPSRSRLDAIVAEIGAYVAGAADFVFLPCDNANHATPAQYRRITEALAPLRLPYRVIPGDHDFEPGDLLNYEAAFPEANRPGAEVIAGHRCIFLDIVSSGAGGPDFRLTMHHRNRLLEELARGEAAGQTPLVFMHAYPGDLAADGDAIARTFADARRLRRYRPHPLQRTAQRRPRDLRRDPLDRTDRGRRQQARLRDRHRARTRTELAIQGVGGTWPFVQIVAPPDLRMVTRAADPRQVPRPGEVEIVAKPFGRTDEPVSLSVDDGPPVAMTAVAGTPLWRAAVPLDAGLHRIAIASGTDRDTIQLFVRATDDIPRRDLPIAPGHDVHAVGAWPEHGIEGTRLGPNRNGGRR